MTERGRKGRLEEMRLWTITKRNSEGQNQTSDRQRSLATIDRHNLVEDFRKEKSILLLKVDESTKTVGRVVAAFSFLEVLTDGSISPAMRNGKQSSGDAHV